MQQAIGQITDIQTDPNMSGGGGVSTTIVDSDREIAFSINSSPTNCSIYINGNDSGYKTPHTLIFREKELNSNSKLIEVYNSSTKLTEKYLITAN